MFKAEVFSVLIASPSNLVLERDAVQRAIDEWNSLRGDDVLRVFVPLRWEYGDYTGFHNDGAQGIINDELASRSDLVIAMLWQNLGSPTKEYASGTLEEIDRAAVRGIPVHILFKTADIPVNTDPDVLRAVQQFQKELRKRALYGEFSTVLELERKVSWILERDSKQNLAAIGQSATNTATIVDPAGTKNDKFLEISWRKSKTNLGTLSIANVSSTNIEGLRVVAKSIGHGAAPNLTEDRRSVVLAPTEKWRVLCLVPENMSPDFEICIHAVVGNEERSEVQVISTR